MSKAEWRNLRNLVLGGYLGISVAWTSVSILNWLMSIIF